MLELPSGKLNGFNKGYEPYTGIKQMDCLSGPRADGQIEDPQFELSIKTPHPCRILSAYAEA